MPSNEELAKLIQQGVDIRKNQELLYLQNEKFIEWVIKRYTGLQYKENEDNGFEDLKQQGYLGMIYAASKFEYERGFKFLTYAEAWIRQSMVRYYGQCGTIRIPSFQRHRLKKYKQYKEKFKRENGRLPQITEISMELHISEKSVKDLEKLDYKLHAISLDEYIMNSSDDSYDIKLIDRMMAEENVEEVVIDSVYLRELHQSLELALDILTKEEIEVIKYKYYQNYSFDQICEIYKCTRQCIYDRLNRAFHKILKSERIDDLMTFMHEGFIYREEYDIRYKEIEEEESEFFV